MRRRAVLPDHEPRNEAEAKPQNQFADAIRPAIYRPWVELVKVSGHEQQVWLHTLEDQLGNFYFPHYLNDDLFNFKKPYCVDEDC
ncbi:MAG: hypothetical protein U9P12_04335 [Verrucomicrobiota bacterium]|nr:hypothetical protein [Verrucomicrobiota bacterium]